ncbi:MAG: sugar ABC transporter permease [Planctomycetes bacterium]|nr:sugar ABC transporter permease [Planctomycetota bacterium]
MYLVILRLLPLLYTIGLSFTSFNFVRDDVATYVGTKNYIRLLSDSRFFHSLKITCIAVVSALTAQMLLGFGLATVFDAKLRGERVLLAAVITPMVIAPVVVGLMWYILFNDLIGPINHFLTLIKIRNPAWLTLPSMALISVVISDIWEWTPFTFLLLFAGMRTISQELYEAARIDGAKWHQLVRYIILPLMKTMIFVTVVLRSMDAIKIFDKVYVMTGGGPGDATDVVAMRIYKTAFVSYQMGYAAAMVVVLLFAVSVLYLLYWRVGRQE